MAWVLVQVRICDQACCRENPRFPINDNDWSDCQYRDGTGDRGCALMRGDALVPDEESKIFEGKTAEEVYQDTCVNWPQENSLRRLGETGACCWKWVDK